MRDQGPPPATIGVDHAGNACWCCYWCGKFFVHTDFSQLGEREVWDCERCGKFQVLGSSMRTAAIAADNGETVTSLPQNMKPQKREEIQQAIEKLKSSGKKPSQKAVVKASGHSRTVVREYWPFVKL